MARLEIEVRSALRATDREDVLALLADASHADGAQPMSDQQWLAVAEIPEGEDPAAKEPGAPETVSSAALTPLALLARAGRDGPLAAYGQLLPGHGIWSLEVVPAPTAPDPDQVAEAVLRAALDRVAQLGGGDVRLWLPSPDRGRRALAEAAGFAPERELHQLRVTLPLAKAAPPGVTVRAFMPGRDEPAWLVANNRAFAGHPEQGTWGLDDLLRREREPWFDPEGFLLHEEDGRVAAFCWTKVHTGARPVMGEIYVIGVDPDFQGRGLGRSLAAAGLDHLARRGIAVGMLYVDGDNAPALGLYRSLGFSVHHTDVALRRWVDPAAGASPPRGG